MPRTEHALAAYNIAAVDDSAAAAHPRAPLLSWIGEPDWAPHIAPLPFAEEFAALRARPRPARPSPTPCPTSGSISSRWSARPKRPGRA